MSQRLNCLEDRGPVTSGLNQTKFHEKNITPTVKHGGSSVMLRGCSAASGPKGLNSEGKYQVIHLRAKAHVQLNYAARQGFLKIRAK